MSKNVYITPKTIDWERKSQILKPMCVHGRSDFSGDLRLCVANLAADQ